MQSQTRRMRTFHLRTNFTTVEKYFITKKGFFNDRNKLKCYKCEKNYAIDDNSMDEVVLHQCGRRPKNLTKDVEIPSPYVPIDQPFHIVPDLYFEEYRYATFRKYHMGSKIKASRLELASDGFYFATKPDILKCIFCKAVVQAKAFPDRTIAEHKKISLCRHKKYDAQMNLAFLSYPLPPLLIWPKTFIYQSLYQPPSVVQWPGSTKQTQSVPTEFLFDREKRTVFAAALHLGFDRLLPKINNVKQLAEFCLTLHANNKAAQAITKTIRQKELTTDCKICMSETIAAIFLPCHHIVACLQCGQKVNKCPTCRARVMKCSRIYF